MIRSFKYGGIYTDPGTSENGGIAPAFSKGGERGGGAFS